MSADQSEITKVFPLRKHVRPWRASSTERAWAAGFFDGEGCTSFYQGGSPRVSVCQNHPELLERFRNAVGGIGSIRGPHLRKATGGFFWTYEAHGNQAFYVIDRLWPWLSHVKREQACDVIARRLESCIRVSAVRSAQAKKRVRADGRFASKDYARIEPGNGVSITHMGEL